MTTQRAHQPATSIPAQKTCAWVLGCTGPGRWRRYCNRHYKILVAAGRIPTRDTDPTVARERIQLHLDRGATYHGIADPAGLDQRTIVNIHTGRTRGVDPAVAGRIMAVPVRPSHVGCARRVQALRRLGWPTAEICRAAGVSVDGLGDALQAGVFTERMAWKIHAAYERLSGTPGPSAMATRIARRGGHPSPMAWEGVDIDDPTAVPDHGTQTKRTRADLVAEFDHLVRCGVSPERAAKQLGVLPGTIDHARHITTRRDGEAA